MSGLRWLGVALFALALVTLALGHADPASAVRPGEGNLVVTVLTRGDRGQVHCGLWAGREGFPTEREQAIAHRQSSIVGGRARCAFDELRVGAEYAVAVFHDESGDGELDTGLFGAPTEGTGASNDARRAFGPPRYDDARFVLPETEHAITIHVGYP